MGLMSLDRWGWGRGHLWTEPGHGVEVGKSNVAFDDSGGGHTGDTGCFEDGHGDPGRARALAVHSRVRAFVTLPDIWGLQFLNQDSDDANK